MLTDSYKFYIFMWFLFFFSFVCFCDIRYSCLWSEYLEVIKFAHKLPLSSTKQYNMYYIPSNHRDITYSILEIIECFCRVDKVKKQKIEAAKKRKFEDDSKNSKSVSDIITIFCIRFIFLYNISLMMCIAEPSTNRK